MSPRGVTKIDVITSLNLKAHVHLGRGLAGDKRLLNGRYKTVSGEFLCTGLKCEG